MLATLTISGSGAGLDPDRVRTQATDDALDHDAVLAAVLVGAQEALAEVVVDGGVGAAAGRAGQGDGRDAGAGAADEELGARADEGRLGRPGAEAEAGRELLAHRAEDRARVMGGGRLDDHLAGQHDLLHLPRRDPPCRLLDRGFEGARRLGAADRRAVGRVRVEQRQGRVGAQAREPRRQLGRPALGVVPGPDDRVDGDVGLLPAPRDRDLGQEERAGLERAPGRRAAALGVEGEAAEPDRAGAGGQPARRLDHRVAARFADLPRDLGEAPRAAPGGLARDPHPGQRELAVGLLPAEPAVARQAGGEDRRGRIGDVGRGGDADQRPPSPAYPALREPREGTQS